MTTKKQYPSKIYNSSLERSLVTLDNFERTRAEIDRLRSRPSTLSIQGVVDCVKTWLELALFGCEVDVGLYVDANQRVMEFYGDSNFVRKVYRGESGGFRALERRESVVETDSKRNTVVFIPILGPTQGHGIIELHGLIQEGTTDLSHFQRSSEMLRKMLAAKDYSFMGQTRFWRRKSIASMAGLNQTNSFIIVSGWVTDLVHTKNGIPFYGGPRFVITWEDGQVDESVSHNELLNLYKETTQSLGGGTVFNGNINQHLLEVASDIGDLLESRKADIFVHELKTKLATQKLNVVGMMELALQSVSTVLSSVKDISLMAFKYETSDFKSLIQYSLDPQTKYSKQYNLTPLLITQEMVDSEGQITELIKADAYSTLWLGAEVAVPKGFLWGKSTFYDQYFMVVHKGKQYAGNELTSYDRKCFFGVLSSIEEAIEALWQVEQTRRTYKEFVKSLESKLFEWRARSLLEICHNALQELQQLLDADMYIGLLESGVQQIKYVVASPTSKMEGKVLKRGQGISFDVVETAKSILLEKNDLDKKKMLVIGATVDILYGRKAFPGKLVKIHGHDMYDVRYDVDNRVEAGVDISRIIPHNKAFQMKSFGVVRLPVIIVPVRNRGKCLGVLTIDNIVHVRSEGKQSAQASGKIGYAAKISADLQVCLEQFGKLLGAALDSKVKKFALESLYIVGKNQYAEIHDLTKALFEAVFTSSCYVSGIVFAETSLQTNGRQNPVHILTQQGEIHPEVMRKIHGFERSKFGKKHVHKLSGSKSVWIICDIASSKKANSASSIYLSVVTFHSLIQDPDFEFMEIIQKALMALIQSIISFRSSGEIRRDALATIKKLCAPSTATDVLTGDASLSRVQFFQQISEAVSSCFAGANLYAGLLGKFNNEINFILASSKSIMAGKQLKRREGAHARNVTFMAIDNEKSVCVTATSPLANSLQHFASKQGFEYPFIATPISAGIDSLIGVLSADACGGHQSTAESDDQLADVVIFFQAVANQMAHKLQQFRKEDFHRTLQQLCLEKSSLSEGYDDLVQALFRYLPFATRVVNLTYQPIVQHSTTNSHAIHHLHGGSDSLREELVVLLCPINFHLHEHYQQNQHQQHSKSRQQRGRNTHHNQQQKAAAKHFLRISWLGEILCDMGPDTEDEDVDSDLLDTYLAVCPAKTSLESLKLVLQVLTSDKKVISRLVLPFHVLEHSMCHDQIVKMYDNSQTTISDAEIGRASMRFKLFGGKDVVGLRLTSIYLRCQFPEQFTPEMQSVCKVYVVIHWNDRSVGRTDLLLTSTSSSSEWLDIGCYLPVASYLENNCLLLELWMEKTRGKNHLLGTATINIVDVSRGALEELAKRCKSTWADAEVLDDAMDLVSLMSYKLEFAPLGVKQLSEEERLTALHLLEDVSAYQESKIAPLKKQRSIRRDEEYMQCELGILRAKYLVPDPDFLAQLQQSSKLRSQKMMSSKAISKRSVGSTLLSEMSTVSSSDSPGWNIFVYATLDGVEVGTSSMVSCGVQGDPVWKDEYLRLSLPVGESIENSSLRLEVYITDESLRQSLLGSVELTGEHIAALFFSKAVRYKWFSLSDCCLYVEETPQELKVFEGLLLLSGRPVSAKTSRTISSASSDDILATKELQLSVSRLMIESSFMASVIQRFKSPDGSNTNTTPVPSAVSVVFNDVKLCQLSLVSPSIISSGGLAMDNSSRSDSSSPRSISVRRSEKPGMKPSRRRSYVPGVSSKAADLGMIGLQKLIFNYPCNRTLFQSVLKINIVFRHGSQGGIINNSVLETLSLSGTSLVRAFGQRGLVTREYNLPPSISFLTASNTTAADNSDDDEHKVCDLVLLSGPKGTIEIYEYDDQELWLDLLGCYNLQKLAPTFQSQNRPNPYCMIYWNEQNVGRSNVYVQQTTVLWKQERFVLRIPIFSSHDDRLSKCRLVIEVYSSKTGSFANNSADDEGEDEMLGSVTIEGSELHTLFRAGTVVMQWCPLMLPSMGTQKLYSANPNNIVSYLKVRGCYSDESEISPVEDTSAPNYLLQVHEAQQLSNTDAFGGATAMVEVIYNKDILGYTKSIPDTINPKYVDERFFLLRDVDVAREELILKVWGLVDASKGQKGSKKKFLGMVELAREYADEFFTKINHKQWFTLMSDPELTAQENSLVKGRIQLEVRKFDALAYLHGPLMAIDSVIWLHSISNLPSIDSFDPYPASMLIVKRKYEKEGDEFEEIYRSSQFTDSHHPRYDREFCPIKVPIAEDWTGFHVLVEVFNKREDILAFKHFEGNSLKALLLRTEKTVLDILDFDLASTLITIDADNVDKGKNDKATAKAASKTPKLRLGGGLRADFEALQTSIKRPVTRSSKVPNTGSALSSKQKGSGGAHGSSVKSMRSMSTRQLSMRGSAKKGYLKIMHIQGHKNPESKQICEVKINGSTSCGQRVIDWQTQPGEYSISGEGIFAMDVTSLDEAVKGGIEITFISCLDTGEAIDIRGQVKLNADILASLKANDWMVEVPIKLMNKPVQRDDDDDAYEENDDAETYDPEDNEDFNVGATVQLCFRTSPMFPEGKTGRSTKRIRSSEVLDFTLSLVEASAVVYNGKVPRSAEMYARVCWGKSNVEVARTGNYALSASTFTFDAEHIKLQSNMGDTYDDLLLLISFHLKRDHKMIAELSIDDSEQFVSLVDAGENGVKLSMDQQATYLVQPPRLWLKMMQMPKTDKLPLYNLKLPSSADDYFEIDCTVICADGLFNAKTMGSTDVVAIVYFGRNRLLELGRTTMYRDSTSPIWNENQSFRFRFPKEFDRIKDALAAAGVFSLKDIQLSVTFNHMHRNGKTLFLGEVILSGEDIQSYFTSPLCLFYKVKASLSASPLEKKVNQKHVGGTAQLVLTKLNRSDISGKDLEIHVLAAKNAYTDDHPLQSTGHQPQGKGPDVYTRLRWNGLIIGATYVDHGSVSPVWDNEKFIARLPGQVPIENALLTVEVWQGTKSKEHDTLIGSKDITGNELKSLFDRSKSGSSWIPLSSSPEVPPRFQTKSILASSTTALPSSISTKSLADKVVPEIELRIDTSSDEVVDTKAYHRYAIEIVRASDLAKIHGSEYNTSPFVVCKWNGREIGRTTTQARTITPNWSRKNNTQQSASSTSTAPAKNVFQILLEKNQSDIGQNTLLFEVWNHRKLRKGEYLGGVQLQKESLRHVFENRQGETIRIRLQDYLPEESRLKRFVQGELIYTLNLVTGDTEHKFDNIFDQELNIDFLRAYDGIAGNPLLELTLEQVYIRPYHQHHHHHHYQQGHAIASQPLHSNAPLKPACKVMWNDHILDVLSASKSVRDPAAATVASMVQDPPRVFSLSFPTQVVGLHGGSTVESGGATAQQEIALRMEVWHDLVDIKGNEVGYLVIPLSSLLRLYCGRFTFSLIAFDSHQALLPWQANITFTLRFMFTYWNTLTTSVPTIFKRRISILGASNLPYINSNLPNTRCHLLLDGISLAKSAVVAGNRDPRYHRISEEIEIDIKHARDLVVEIIYVDPRNRKEIVLGREEIPFETIIRPPREPFEIFLGPSGQIYEDYSFPLSGSVRVEIRGSNRYDASYSSWAMTAGAHVPSGSTVISETASVISHITGTGQHEVTTLEDPMSYHLVLEGKRINVSSTATTGSTAVVTADGKSTKRSSQSQPQPPQQPQLLAADSLDDNSSVVSWLGSSSLVEVSSMIDGRGSGGLKEIDRRWLGTLTCYSLPQEVSSRPDWLVMPLWDIGVEIGSKKSNFTGINPGVLTAFGIQRSLDHLAVSDATLLQDVSFEVSACWVRLRWKEIYRKLRAIALKLLKDAARELLLQIEQGELLQARKDYVRNEVYDFIESILKHCLPGCDVTFVQAAADFTSVQYETKVAAAGSAQRRNQPKASLMGLNLKSSVKRNELGSSGVQRVAYPKDYGQDIFFLGRNFQRSSMVVHLQDLRLGTQSEPVVASAPADTTLNVNDGSVKLYSTKSSKPPPPVAPKSKKAANKTIVANCSTSQSMLFPHSFLDHSFPRFTISMFSEDVALGLFQVQNFDLYRGGAYNSHTNVISNHDVQELRSWLESVGEIAGDVLYKALERDAITKVLTYMQYWDSSLPGVLAVLLEEVSNVLQGCRLMEVVTMDQSLHRLISLQEKAPTPSRIVGQKIQIHSMRVFARTRDGTADDDMVSVGSRSSLGSLDLFGAPNSNNNGIATGIAEVIPSWQALRKLFGRRGSMKTSMKMGGLQDGNNDDETAFYSFKDDKSLDDSESELGDGSIGGEQQQQILMANALSTYVPNLLLGLQYDGLEHVHPLRYDPATDAFLLPSETQDMMTLYLKSDRRVVVHIYEVDHELHPINQHSGTMHLSKQAQQLQHQQQQLAQTSADDHRDGQLLKVLLQPVTPKNPVLYELMYDVDMHGTTDSEEFSTDLVHNAMKGTKVPDKASITHRQDSVSYMTQLGYRGVTLQIVQASDLKKMAKDVLPTAYCEVYRGKKLVGSTTTVKTSQSPVWNSSIFVPFEESTTSGGNGKNRSSSQDDKVFVEVYDMTFLRRGNFLGRVEFSLDSLLTNTLTMGSLEHDSEKGEGGNTSPLEEHALQMKGDIQAQKQVYVGGCLYLRHTLEKIVDTTKVENVDQDIAHFQQQPSLQSLDGKAALKHLRRMRNPYLKLTVQSASRLMAANRFTGTSDPYVNIYLGNSNNNNVDTQALLPQQQQMLRASAEVVARTKVVSDDRNPVWEETFTLPILLPNVQEESQASDVMTSAVAAGGSTSTKIVGGIRLDDFPVFRLEVYGASKLGAPTFLGATELTPLVYGTQRERYLELTGRVTGPTSSTTATAATTNTVAVAGASSKNSGKVGKDAQKVKAVGNNKKETGNSSAEPASYEENHLFAHGILHLTWTLEDSAMGSLDDSTGAGEQSRVPPAFRYLSYYGKVEIVVVRANDVLRTAQHQLQQAVQLAQQPTGVSTASKPSFFNNFSAGISGLSSGLISSHPNCNPFVQVKFRDAVLVGQTRIKANTVHPEFHERFIVYVDPQDPQSLCDLVFEIWHKDTHFLMPQDACLGICKVPPVEYLHPLSQMQPYQLQMPPSAIHRTESKSRSFMGGTSVKDKGNADDSEVAAEHPGRLWLKLSYQRQRQTLPLQPLTNRRAHQPYAQLLHKHQKRQEANVIPLTMIYDPDAEKLRQQQENSNFPQLLQRTSQQRDRYENNPFVRTGVISEVHYGQLVAAYRRGERTILRTSKMESICVPLFQRPSQQQQHQLKEAAKGQASKKDDDNDEETGGTKKDLKGEDKVDSKTPKDIASAEKKKAKARHQNEDAKKKEAPVAITGTMVLPHYVACRYPLGQVPRRDLKFLQHLQQQLYPALQRLDARQQRLLKLQQLHDTLQSLRQLQLSPSDLLVQALLDYELSAQARVKVYLLDDFGAGFLPVSPADGKTYTLGGVAAATAETAMQESAPQRQQAQSKANKHNFAHIQILARAVRHDLVLQYYRGVLHVAKRSWKQQTATDSSCSTTSVSSGKHGLDHLHPLSLPVFDAVQHTPVTSATGASMPASAASLLDDLEYDCPGFSDRLLDIFARHYASGAVIMPLVVLNEHVLGMVVVRELDASYPPAVYTYTEEEIATGDADKDEGEVSTPLGDKSPSPKDENDEDNDGSCSMSPTLKATSATPNETNAIQRVEALEDGVLRALLQANEALAYTLVQSRLTNLYRALKSLPIKLDALPTPLLVMRYTLRMLCRAFPSIQEISIWLWQWQRGFQVTSSSLDKQNIGNGNNNNRKSRKLSSGSSKPGSAASSSKVSLVSNHHHRYGGRSAIPLPPRQSSGNNLDMSASSNSAPSSAPISQNSTPVASSKLPFGTQSQSQSLRGQLLSRSSFGASFFGTSFSADSSRLLPSSQPSIAGINFDHSQPSSGSHQPSSSDFSYSNSAFGAWSAASSTRNSTAPTGNFYRADSSNTAFQTSDYSGAMVDKSEDDVSVSSASSGVTPRAAPGTTGGGGFLSRFFNIPIFQRNRTFNRKKMTGSTLDKIDENAVNHAAALQAQAASGLLLKPVALPPQSEAPIVCGVFGTEEPQHLLRTPLERKLYTGASTTNTVASNVSPSSTTANNSRANTANTANTAGMSRRSHQQAQTLQRDVLVLQQAAWQIAVPRCFLHTPAVTVVPTVQPESPPGIDQTLGFSLSRNATQNNDFVLNPSGDTVWESTPPSRAQSSGDQTPTAPPPSLLANSYQRRAPPSLQLPSTANSVSSNPQRGGDDSMMWSPMSATSDAAPMASSKAPTPLMSPSAGTANANNVPQENQKASSSQSPHRGVRGHLKGDRVSLAQAELTRVFSATKQTSCVLSTGHVLVALASPSLSLPKPAEPLPGTKPDAKAKEARDKALQTLLLARQALREHIFLPALQPYVRPAIPAAMSSAGKGGVTTGAGGSRKDGPLKHGKSDLRTGGTDQSPAGNVSATGDLPGRRNSQGMASPTVQASSQSQHGAPALTLLPPPSSQRAPPPSNASSRSAVSTSLSGNNAQQDRLRRNALLLHQPHHLPAQPPTDDGYGLEAQDIYPAYFFAVRTLGLSGHRGWGTLCLTDDVPAVGGPRESGLAGNSSNEAASTVGFLQVLEVVGRLLEENLAKWQRAYLQNQEQQQLAAEKAQRLKREQAESERRRKLAQEDADAEDGEVPDNEQLMDSVGDPITGVVEEVGEEEGEADDASSSSSSSSPSYTNEENSTSQSGGTTPSTADLPRSHHKSSTGSKSPMPPIVGTSVIQEDDEDDDDDEVD